jgi:FkbM family methyltransferase
MRIRGVARLALETRRVRGSFDSWRMGLYRWAPNYAVFPKDDACVVDIGVGDSPDFSAELARVFRARCLVVDPTRKHTHALRAWCERHPNFEYLCAALGSQSGQVEFFESRRDESGSTFPTHRNVAAGDVDAYEVAVVTIDDLVRQAGGHVDILKMDVEGAEFEVLERASSDALSRIDQLLVEFHDGTIPEFSRRDRERAMRPLIASGFTAVEYNGRDVLFLKPAALSGRRA